VRLGRGLRIILLGGLAIPALLMAAGATRLTQLDSIAYPAHAVVGTVLSAIGLSPTATAVQWFKAAAHARSKTDLERVARGITAALERDADGEALRAVCGLQAAGNVRQLRAIVWSGAKCGRLAQNVTLEASVAPSRASAGTTVQITGSVTSASSVAGLVDVEIHDRDARIVAQWIFPDQDLAAEQPHEYAVTWEIPSHLPTGEYSVELGVFRHGWTAIHGWRNSAATLTIVP
jgi:hypothetical protein